MSMFHLVHAILCCCLLRTCNVALGVTISTCSSGLVTLENNATMATFVCTGMSNTSGFWALNGKDIVVCSRAACQANDQDYLVTWEDDKNVLNVKGNLTNKIDGNLTCGDYSNDGKRINVYNCFVNFKVDGGWSSWSDHGFCTLTCGGGSQTRTRTCTESAPFLGNYCVGTDTSSTVCNTQECTADRGGSSCSGYRSCALTCEEDSQTGTQNCTNSAQDNDKYCADRVNDSTSCTTQGCPVDGGWSLWTSYGYCTRTCGGGSQIRLRTCTNPAPYQGNYCSGPEYHSTVCSTQGCHLAGGADAILAKKDPIERRNKALEVMMSTLEWTDLLLTKLESNQDDESGQSNGSFTKQDLRYILSTLEDVGPIIASALNFGEVMYEMQTNMESIFAKTAANFTYITHQFSDSSYFELYPKNSFDAVQNTTNDTSIGLCAFYIDKVENLVYNLSLKNNPRKAGGSSAEGVSQTVVNTKLMVIAVRVADVSRQNFQLSDNISLTLHVKYTQGLTRPACVSFDAENLSPTSLGCYSQQLNPTHVRCLCSHLTSFAVLMSVVETDERDPVLDMLSSICLSLSCVCLLLATLTFCSFSNLRWSRYFTLANLSFSLGMAQMLYLLGIYQVSNKAVCAVIAGLLHFWFLAAFCWMGVDGLQIYQMLVIVYHTSRKKIPIYVLIGYGVPTNIVAISASLRYDGYGMKTHCWLSQDGWLHMAFIGPVVVIIIWNTVMLFIAMMYMRRQLHGPSFHRENLKKQLKGAVSLLCVLGVTWLFGLIQFQGSWSIVFSYIFVLLNGTQGVFIFVFQCLFSRQVMTEYYRAVYKSNILPPQFKETVLNFLSKGTDSTTKLGGIYPSHMEASHSYIKKNRISMALSAHKQPEIEAGVHLEESNKTLKMEADIYLRRAGQTTEDGMERVHGRNEQTTEDGMERVHGRNGQTTEDGMERVHGRTRRTNEDGMDRVHGRNGQTTEDGMERVHGRNEQTIQDEAEHVHRRN